MQEYTQSFRKEFVEELLEAGGSVPTVLSVDELISPWLLSTMTQFTGKYYVYELEVDQELFCFKDKKSARLWLDRCNYGSKARYSKQIFD